MNDNQIDTPNRPEKAARWLLFALGLGSALVYLLAFTWPYWLPDHYLDVKDEIYQFTAREPWRGILFCLALALLFIVYWLAYRVAARLGRRRLGFWLIAAWASAFCLLLIPVQPITSSDVYGYTFQGRVVAVHGQNPFVHYYRDFASDPFYFVVTFHHLPATTGYGPLWVAIEAGLGWLARDGLLLNVVLFKGLAAMCHLLGAWLVYATVRRWAPDRALAAMLFWAWNPLLLLELVGNAHNDAALAALSLLGFWLLARNRGLWAIACLSAAVTIKPVVAIWLPLVGLWLLTRRRTWPERVRWAVAAGLAVLLPVVIAYVPFWAGAATFRGLLNQSDIHGNSLPNALIWGLRGLWPAAAGQIVAGVKLLTALAFAPFYGCQLWTVTRPGVEGRAVIRASFDVMLFYLLFVGLQFMPWYVAWLLVPAALLLDPLRRRLVVLLSMLAPLLYFPFGWQWLRASLPQWSLALVAALPLLGLAAWLGIRAVRGQIERAGQG